MNIEVTVGRQKTVIEEAYLIVKVPDGLTNEQIGKYLDEHESELVEEAIDNKAWDEVDEEDCTSYLNGWGETDHQAEEAADYELSDEPEPCKWARV